MPSFSFTAPIITPTEEQSERDGLDESMRRALHADVSGLPYSETSVGGPASHLSQSKFVKILETLPKRERSACLEVLKKAPGLFQSETPLSLYMGSECGQAEKVVNKVSQYWKQRYRIFGASRAFLPMTLEGAMAEDLPTLEKGFLSVLPNDEAGRPVVFFDRIRAIPTVAPRDAVSRCLFYILQKVTHGGDALTKGFVLIENICGYDLYTHLDRIMIKRQMELLRDCFPSTLKAYHVCAGYSGRWVVDIIMPMVKQIAGKHIRLRTICHMGNSRDVLSNMQAKYSLIPKNQSIIIGGEVSYGYHLTWIDQQMASESLSSSDSKLETGSLQDSDLCFDLESKSMSSSCLYGKKRSSSISLRSSESDWKEELIEQYFAVGPHEPDDPIRNLADARPVVNSTAAAATGGLTPRRRLVLRSSWNGDVSLAAFGDGENNVTNSANPSHCGLRSDISSRRSNDRPSHSTAGLAPAPSLASPAAKQCRAA